MNEVRVTMEVYQVEEFEYCSCKRCIFDEGTSICHRPTGVKCVEGYIYAIKEDSVVVSDFKEKMKELRSRR